VTAAARRHPGRQRGLTTAEYALGTVAVVTGVGVLVALFADPTVPTRVFWPVLRPLIAFILHIFGLAGA
jgi:hypothetical protein